MGAPSLFALKFSHWIYGYGKTPKLYPSWEFLRIFVGAGYFDAPVKFAYLNYFLHVLTCGALLLTSRFRCDSFHGQNITKNNGFADVEKFRFLIWTLNTFSFTQPESITCARIIIVIISWSSNNRNSSMVCAFTIMKLKV